MNERAAVPWYLQPVNLALFVIVLTVVRLSVAGSIGLVEDEAYYRLWGLYPALGYYDHPPMVGWWIWLGQAIFGDNPLGLRFVGVISAAAGSLFLWRTAFVLFDMRVAGWSVLFLNVTLLVGVGALIATPDAPSVLFWGLALWSLAELNRSQNPNWWLLVGVFAGFGLLSKYSVFFLGAGILLWLLWVPQNRRYFLAWQLWVGGALALLVFSPVLWWNANNEWISFTKQFGRVVATDYTLKYIGEYIGAVAGLLNPLVFILALVGTVALIKKTWERKPAASLLVTTILPFLVYLTLHSLHSRVQGNWPAPVYPTLAMCAAYAVSIPQVATLKSWRGKVAAGAVALGVFAAGFVYLHALSPIVEGLARKDPTHQLRSWSEIGEKVAVLAEDEAATWVLTTSYGMTGQLSNALKRQRIGVYQVNERLRYKMIPPQAQQPAGNTMLYVVEERRDQADRFRSQFDRVELITEIPRLSGNSPIEGIRVYRLSDPTAGSAILSQSPKTD